MKNLMNRRDAIITGGALAANLVLARSIVASADTTSPPNQTRSDLFRISLAQWSLHRALFSGELDNLDFAALARGRFDLEAVEYVNQFFIDKAGDDTYLASMKQRADEAGVRSLLIMVDGEGRLGNPDQTKRAKAVANHQKWVHAAKTLGCHSIRVNASSEGSFNEQLKLAADGLRTLTEYASALDLNVIVENHGGLSSNGTWIAALMQQIDHPRCGTLPDFGNFHLGGDRWYDRYDGVREMMPFAKAVSAKSHDFNDFGDETHTDYRRMMTIVLGAGYHGFVGIEYEGESLGELEGILRTKQLLERVRAQLAVAPAATTRPATPGDDGDQP